MINIETKSSLLQIPFLNKQQNKSIFHSPSINFTKSKTWRYYMLKYIMICKKKKMDLRM